MTKPIHPARTFLRGFAVGCVTIASLVTVVSSQNHSSRIWSGIPAEELSDAERGRRLVDKTYDRLSETFYREIEEEDIYAFINGGLQALDKYSSHVPVDAYQALSGEVPVGTAQENPYRLGVLGATTDKAFIIQTAAPGSPAYKAGVRPGDRLVSVEGESVEQMTGQQAFERLLKAVETHQGVAFDFSVNREGVVVELEIAPEQLAPTYAFDMGSERGIPHIVVTGFYPGAAQTVREILEQYKDRGEIRGVVLDVRNNVGGRVSEVEEMSSLFAPKGTLIYSSSSRIEGDREYYTTGLAPFKGVPVAVLTNSQSASASEILAGFIQANGFGKVVGQQTYGKGTVQTVMPLDEKAGAIRITIGKYHDAGDRVIQDVGVTPDIIVETQEEELLERPPYGEYDEALDKGREWILSGEELGTIATHPRPHLPPLPDDRDL